MEHRDDLGQTYPPTTGETNPRALLVEPIPAFSDNYLWLLHDGHHAVVVDPGDAAPVRDSLKTRDLRLAAILVTHSHADHVGGIASLLEEWPVPVYGPSAEPVPGLTHAVGDGCRVGLRALGLELEVLDVPGHTRGHVAYYGQERLFCGDTLFACGCGRIDQPAAVMYASLERLASLPDDTLVYCTHEYTQANIRFALSVDPDNTALQQRAKAVAQLRARGAVSLPSTIAEERATNPFLRCREPALRAAAEAAAQHSLPTPTAVFGQLRCMKDSFRS